MKIITSDLHKENISVAKTEDVETTTKNKFIFSRYIKFQMCDLMRQKRQQLKIGRRCNANDLEMVGFWIRGAF